MFKSFDDVVSYMGNFASKRVDDFPRTRLIHSPYGVPGGIVLRYRFNSLLTYYPQHIVLNTAITQTNSQGAVRKRANAFLPHPFAIKNKGGIPYLFNDYIPYDIEKGMVLDWHGHVLKPCSPANILLDRIEDMYIWLRNERCPVDFDDTSCFLCGTQVGEQPLYHDMGLDYHFLEHFYDDDPYPAYMLLDMCREYEKFTGNTKMSTYRHVEYALCHRHNSFSGNDYGYMARAFQWFIKDRLGIEVG